MKNSFLHLRKKKLWCVKWEHRWVCLILSYEQNIPIMCVNEVHACAAHSIDMYICLCVFINSNTILSILRPIKINGTKGNRADASVIFVQQFKWQLKR